MTDSPTPSVSVIVPVYNDVDRLRTCLAALAAQDYTGPLDVVVADNASTEDVGAALPPGDARFTVVREMQKGSYAARNAAVRVARGAILAFTDADCVPHATWVSRAVAVLADPTGAPDAVGGRVNLTFRSAAGPTTGPELYEAIEGFDQDLFVRTAHFAATANLVVPRRVFEEVGPFNATLQSGGDLEWGQRLHARGLRLQYVDDAVIDHPSRPTWRELTKKTIRIANGHADLYSDPATAVFAANSWHDLRQTFTVWWSVWRAEWPTSPAAKLRLAAARSYAGLLEIVVRTRRRAWRPAVATRP